MNVWNEGDQSLRHARVSIGSNLLADYETVPVVYLVPREPGAHGSLLPSWHLVWPPLWELRGDCGLIPKSRVELRLGVELRFTTGCRDPKTGRDLDRSRTHQCEC